MRLKPESGRELLVHGPATVRVFTGSASSLGKPLASGEALVVRAGRTRIIEVLEDSELDIVVGQNGKVNEIEESTIPREWTAFVREIIEKRQEKHRIMILGGLDTGKNTFITYSSNMLIKEESKVAVLDADMGQAEVGPPTTMSVATLNEPISELLEYSPDSIYFVGATSPAYLVNRVLQGTEQLMEFVEENAKEAVLFVNMPGWIAGSAAVSFVREMISRIGVSHLVALQREGEVEHILGEVTSKVQITRLPVSPYAVPRNRDERKFLRETSYRKYFSHATEVTAHYSAIDFSPLFASRGKPATSQVVRKVGDAVKSRVLYCEEAERSINAVVTDFADAKTEVIGEESQQQEAAEAESGSPRPSQKELRVISLRELGNIVVAVFGKSKVPVSLGILRRLDFHSRRASIVMTTEISMIDRIEVGKIRVTPQGYEVGNVEIHRIQT
ncbi:MAG: Clp1/GlmU family protein [Promethearchaeati archaeon SRVP18_Atabeyarchaeia-1]